MLDNKQLILASNSPRRREILKDAGFDFEVIVSDFEEKDVALSPIETAINNALGKAQATFDNLGNKNAVVLGADTVVFYNNTLLGKPKDSEDAVKMLKTLSGNTHTVVTGYAIITQNGTLSGFSESKVTFNKLKKEQIDKYVKSGKPLDKAGAYGIQDGYDLVKNFEGSLNNVIGLPIEQIAPILKEKMKEAI